MDKKLINQKLDLVMDKLMNLDTPDIKMDKAAAPEEMKKGLYTRDFGIREWDWPQGVGLYGLMQLQAARGTREFDAFLLDWVENNLRIGLPSANINTTAPFLTLFELTERYDRPAWEKLCMERADYLVQSLPRTQWGGFEHVTSNNTDRNDVNRNPEQLWADTLFMAVLFLGKMGVRYGRQAWIDEAVYQYLIHIKYLADNRTGFLYHGWTFLEHSHFGGVFWNRGDSWFTMGAVAFLRAMEGHIGAADKRFILSAWQNQVRALLSVQDAGELWHTVLTNPGTYIETSGSGAITAGILAGIRYGYLDQGCLPAAKKAVEALLEYIGEDGTVGSVSAGTSMGMDEQHYKDILIRPMAYGQSLAALALTEALYWAEEG